MTRPGHVHLRLSAANLDGLDRWATAHGITRNEAANQLFERFLGGEEMGRIQRAVMLAESLTANLEKLDDAHTQAAATAGFAHRQLLTRLTSIELIATETLFLLRARLAADDPDTYKEVEAGMRSAARELRRQLRHDIRDLRTPEDGEEDEPDDDEGEDEEEDDV